MNAGERRVSGPHGKVEVPKDALFFHRTQDHRHRATLGGSMS